MPVTYENKLFSITSVTKKRNSARTETEGSGTQGELPAKKQKNISVTSALGGKRTITVLSTGE